MGIDVPDADQCDIFGPYLGAETLNISEVIVAFAEQMGQRHAVDISGG